MIELVLRSLRYKCVLILPFLARIIKFFYFCGFRGILNLNSLLNNSKEFELINFFYRPESTTNQARVFYRYSIVQRPL